MSNRVKLIVFMVAIAAIVYGFFAFDIPYKKSPAPVQTAAEKILVDSPQPGATVSSPASLSGKALGTWFFEASFPIEILDSTGKVLGQGHADAQGDWMTTEFVPWTASISFTVGSSTAGIIRLMKDNPSGDPVRDEHIDVSVSFKK